MLEEKGTKFKLANCVITRIDLDTEHHYFGKTEGGEEQYFISLTRTLDIGAPFPEGLRQYLKMSTLEEQTERLNFTGERGSKLHNANETLMQGAELDLEEDYKSDYEKDAITTFIRFMRFLAPEKFETEQVVADPEIRVAGTLDFVCSVDKWKLEVLLEPNKYLELDNEGDYQLKEKWLDLPYKARKQRVIIDYKYTGRNAYNHKVQVGAYKTMYNKSYKFRASRAFTFRYSAKHKFRFDFQESFATYRDYKRIYDTAIDYLGKFPEPPRIVIYPKKVKLFNKIKEKSYV